MKWPLLLPGNKSSPPGTPKTPPSGGVFIFLGNFLFWRKTSAILPPHDLSRHRIVRLGVFIRTHRQHAGRPFPRVDGLDPPGPFRPRLPPLRPPPPLEIRARPLRHRRRPVRPHVPRLHDQLPLSQVPRSRPLHRHDPHPGRRPQRSFRPEVPPLQFPGRFAGRRRRRHHQMGRTGILRPPCRLPARAGVQPLLRRRPARLSRHHGPPAATRSRPPRLFLAPFRRLCRPHPHGPAARARRRPPPPPPPPPGPPPPPPPPPPPQPCRSRSPPPRPPPPSSSGPPSPISASSLPASASSSGTAAPASSPPAASPS